MACMNEWKNVKTPFAAASSPANGRWESVVGKWLCFPLLDDSNFGPSISAGVCLATPSSSATSVPFILARNLSDPRRINQCQRLSTYCVVCPLAALASKASSWISTWGVNSAKDRKMMSLGNSQFSWFSGLKSVWFVKCFSRSCENWGRQKNGKS